MATPKPSIKPAQPRAPTLTEAIAANIYLIRGRKVMLDADLADLYGVETKALVQAVTRNRERFPPDFSFRLSWKELMNLKSQIVTSSWGGRRKPPHAFTEQGIAMLSGVHQGHEKQFVVVFDAIRKLLDSAPTKRGGKIGFHS